MRTSAEGIEDYSTRRGTHVAVAAVMAPQTTIIASSSFVAMFLFPTLYAPFCGVARVITYFKI
jgi:hypothetical protein